MNYNYADGIYRKYGMADKLTDDFFNRTAKELACACQESNIECNVVF
jgi:hypothetical protein